MKREGERIMKRQLRTLRRSRGFTLIELMMVVAIIGLLSSMGLPAFRGYLYRTKRTERELFSTRIRQSVTEAFESNNGRFPIVSGTTSSLTATANPPFATTPGGLAKAWIPTEPGWDRVSFEPTSKVYFSYAVSALSAGPNGRPQVVVTTVGDLDGNGVLSQCVDTWEKISGSWVQTIAPSGSCATAF